MGDPQILASSVGGKLVDPRQEKCLCCFNEGSGVSLQTFSTVLFVLLVSLSESCWVVQKVNLVRVFEEAAPCQSLLHGLHISEGIARTTAAGCRRSRKVCSCAACEGMSILEVVTH